MKNGPFLVFQVIIKNTPCPTHGWDISNNKAVQCQVKNLANGTEHYFFEGGGGGWGGQFSGA